MRFQTTPEGMLSKEPGVSTEEANSADTPEEKSQRVSSRSTKMVYVVVVVGAEEDEEEEEG
jgi:hypothetical protein